ncbi:putative bifunctional diguanylate cyclase/phosphodiesterase [Pengzhenrongella frigida]|uniref:EAL domain-containing protein n=1 Tax=Pengzhenrongella frigida TaxID=1259133 RepID=A0A4Q5N524_9MICO|nr:EAL domain-containing protein [Cellulomonas sp. HLT2-17]RYV51151.1 EAL domain-containing protein [Cellulomonas sp. HLT2-17]
MTHRARRLSDGGPDGAAPVPASPADRIRHLLGPRAFVVVCCLALLPVMVGANAYLTQHVRAQIAFHERERIGVLYLRPVTTLLGLVVQEQTAVREQIGADGDPDGAVDAVVDAAVAAVDAADREYGTVLATSARWSAWKRRFDRVPDSRPATGDDVGELATGLAGLLLQVANASNLVLDPHTDSYYLVHVLVVSQPILLDELVQAERLATLVDRTVADRDLLVIARSTLDRTAATIAVDLATTRAGTADAPLEAAIAPPSAALARTVATTSTALVEVLDGRTATLDVAAAVAAMRTLDTACVEQLDRLVAGRIADLRQDSRNVTEVLAVLAALLLLLTLGLSRALGILRQRTAELRHQAMHDSLTGLPNRALVLERVEQAVVRARRGDSALAVMFVDLDGFKGVNDTYGHAVGDQLLRAVGRRLSSVLRATDTVGRLGGDEFVVLTEGPTLGASPESIAERLKAVLAAPFELDGTQGVALRAHASIGIAVGARAIGSDLLRDADVALYEAKAAGKDCHVVFQPQMQRAVQERLEVEMDLGRAVGAGEFFLDYQPAVDLRTEQITGVEALVRWNHPTRGVVMPEEFIAIAEESGLIVSIGRAILGEACRQAASWQRQGHRISMAVNVSGRQFDRHGDLLAVVLAALDDSGLDPGLLTLEITETILMRDADRSAAQLLDLKGLGLRLAIDDFGTGYSSLAYLQQFPVDVLKIDRSFIRDVATAGGTRALVHAFVELGRSFGLETWAEGIEDRHQLRCLQDEGCDSGQGYLFGRPLSAAAVESLINEQTGAAREPAPTA